MKKIKLNAGRIFLLGMALIILAGLVLRLITPKNNQTWQQENQTSLTQENLDRTHSVFKKIGYSGKKLFLPETLPVVEVESNPAFSASKQIATTLGLENGSDNPNYWVNQDWTLVLDSASNLLLLSSNLTPQLKQSINKDRAIKASIDWMEKIKLPTNLLVDESNIQYFEGEYELRPSTPGMASFIQIPLSYAIEGYPLWLAQDLTAPYQLTLDSNYQLHKLAIHQVEILKTQSVAQKNTIDIDQAIKNIKQKGSGAIIGVNNAKSEYSLLEIQQANLNRVSLEYRLEKDGKTAIPYYKFTGQIVFNNLDEAEATIITPAIEL